MAARTPAFACHVHITCHVSCIDSIAEQFTSEHTEAHLNDILSRLYLATHLQHKPHVLASVQVCLRTCRLCAEAAHIAGGSCPHMVDVQVPIAVVCQRQLLHCNQGFPAAAVATSLLGQQSHALQGQLEHAARVLPARQPRPNTGNNVQRRLWIRRQ